MAVWLGHGVPPDRWVDEAVAEADAATFDQFMPV
jgi:hypothetical protein